MTEVPLSHLKQWYEENVCRTPTLEILRTMFQGNFPGGSTSQVTNLGKDWQLFEARREELGDAEFRIYLQCQMAAWKEYHKEKPFYPGYCIGDKAGLRYLERREKMMQSGYHFFGSEIYRAVFPNECDALHEYFRRWLCWDGQREEEEPNWPGIKAALAPRYHPFWTYFSCNYETATDRGPEFCEIWLAGKKRALARRLIQDSNEYDRACIDALLLTSQQILPRAGSFILLPYEGFSFPYQIAIQLHELRKEILSFSPTLRIRMGDGNEKIDGFPS